MCVFISLLASLGDDGNRNVKRNWGVAVSAPAAVGAPARSVEVKRAELLLLLRRIVVVAIVSGSLLCSSSSLLLRLPLTNIVRGGDGSGPSGGGAAA